MLSVIFGGVERAKTPWWSDDDTLFRFVEYLVDDGCDEDFALAAIDEPENFEEFYREWMKFLLVNGMLPYETSLRKAS